ncbi:hypothetical protein [Burkholderia ambifaria]|uniref:hypothetical protein n=1 Tax=Burkholderia ambifaria TaxID=152480 RepID=UPI00158D63D4|nr:hypothetical protein [Burkholderia ambifaria]
MQSDDFDNFARVLDAAYSLHSKSLTSDARALFFAALGAYSLADVRKAFSAHVKDPHRGQYPPKPADIIAQLIGDASKDGRPEPDEAWAIAIRSADERETVVWTQEIAEAWVIASPVFDGDEIGARMAFKAAYVRIVDRNRGANLAPQWVVSQGFDAQRRIEVVEHAVRAGRLQLAHAQAVVPLLTGESDPAPGVDVEANLARLKAIVGGVGSAQARASAEKLARAREDAEHTAELKRAAARRVASYAAEVRA